MWLVSCLCTLISVQIVVGSFNFPEVTLNAFENGGFQVSIPAVDDKIQAFNFHANKNRKINWVDPGEFWEDISAPRDGLWAYKNTEEKLLNGDKIHYWIFVQHNQLGYKRYGVLEVKSYTNPEDLKCRESLTKVDDRSSCVGRVIFQDEFSADSVNTNKWTEEKFIPNDDSNREFGFAYYTPQMCTANEGKLTIKPQVLAKEDFYNDLDLTRGCTSTRSEECQQRYAPLNIPPVKSCLLSSKFQFRYGSIEIKAQLPKGDWLYPDIYLELLGSSTKRIYIAYSRGNDVLNYNGQEIGGRTVFFGPWDKSQHNSAETKFSKMLSKSENALFSDKTRVFKLTWLTNTIELSVDGESFGSVAVDSSFGGNARLVIGVGVGGVNEFPEVPKKPWKNSSRSSREEFYNSTISFSSTWTPLIVEYVRLNAI